MVCFPYPKRMCANIDVDQGAARAAVLVRSRARRGRPRRPHGVPARGGRGARPLLRHRALSRSPTRPAIAAAGRRRARGRRHRRRRRRALRPLLVLPVGGADRDARARHRRRRPAPAHRHRRARLRGRTGEQLPDARDRADGRGAARRSRRATGCTTALGWYVTKHAAGVWSTRAARGRLPARRPGDDPGAGRRAARARVRPGSSTATVDDRGDVGRVRARRHARRSASSPRCTADGRRAIADVPRRRPARARSPTEPWEGRHVRVTNDGSTNTVARVGCARWPISRVAATMLWRGMHPPLRPLRIGQAVPALVPHGRRLPALRPALRARSRATSPARSRSTSILVGGLFAIVFVTIFVADDPRHPGRARRSRSASRSSCSARSSPTRSRRRSGSRSTARSCSSWTSTSARDEQIRRI